MIRLRFIIVTASFVLAACNGQQAPAAGVAPAAAPAPAGPPTYTNILAGPAAYAGKPVEFPIVQAAGNLLFLSGETGTISGQSWEEPPGTEHSVAPPPGYVVGKPCIFVVVKEDNTPVLPLQPIVVDNLEPCFAQSSFHSIKLSGKVAEVRDVQLEVNKAPATLKALVLTDPDFVTPKL